MYSAYWMYLTYWNVFDLLKCIWPIEMYSTYRNVLKCFNWRPTFFHRRPQIFVGDPKLILVDLNLFIGVPTNFTGDLRFWLEILKNSFEIHIFPLEDPWFLSDLGVPNDKLGVPDDKLGVPGDKLGVLNENPGPPMMSLQPIHNDVKKSQISQTLNFVWSANVRFEIYTVIAGKQ